MKGEPLTWEAQPHAGTGAERRYRADAQVLLFAIPLLRRKGVGDGAAIWRESTGEGGQTTRLLEFTGRSIPDRAAGLNRFGFIRELSRADAESLYFGLMTASPEESSEQARKALHSAAADVMYSVIEGHVASGQNQTVSAQFTAPARLSSDDRGELMTRARRALTGTTKKTDTPDSSTGPRLPFLHAVASLMNQPGQTETRYIYNGRPYRLRIERSPDRKAAEHFRSLHLLGPTANVIRMAGRLRRQAGGKETEFRLWIEEGVRRPLPLRVEYQPKSYLRLVFEAQA